ncbi:MAG: VOC family protein [bacterium]
MHTHFDHIAITSTNISDSIEFYEKNFVGVEILYQDATWAFLEIGGTHLALVTPGEHPPHLSFSVHTKKDLEDFAEKVKGKIVVHRDHSESFYFKDPSDNAIEIVWYPEGESGISVDHSL